MPEDWILFHIPQTRLVFDGWHNSGCGFNLVQVPHHELQTHAKVQLHNYAEAKAEGR